MNERSDDVRKSINEYCSIIGADPLLVQGAGGNVSWKDRGTLWIKASGTWLAEAVEKDIFVPVDMQHLRSAIERGDFSVTPVLLDESHLRPSIETFLHALMPHKVVVHLHAVEVLAHLVRENCEVEFRSLLAPSILWTAVDYHKPGAALASAVSLALARAPDADVIFLKNHGVVIGGENIAEINQTLNRLTDALTAPSAKLHVALHKAANVVSPVDQYVPITDMELHQLAINPDLFKRLSSAWALYPDHVVFLGDRAHTYKTGHILSEEIIITHEVPELVFVEGEGVFVTPAFNKAKRAQLRCYYDVLVRQKFNSSIRAITSAQISELVNWDAEQYRMQLRK